MAMKSISVRMDGDLLDKMHVVAAAEQRSGNGYIVHLIMRNVEAVSYTHLKGWKRAHAFDKIK